jgi:hypothetical protein
VTIGQYVTLANLQVRIPQYPLTPTSKPSAADVEVYVADVTAEFEGEATNAGYVTPIVGAQSLYVAREAIILRTIARLLYARAAGVGGDAAMQSADKFAKMADDYWKALWDPKQKPELIDCPRTGLQMAKPPADVRSLWTEFPATEPGDPRVTMSQLF